MEETPLQRAQRLMLEFEPTRLDIVEKLRAQGWLHDDAVEMSFNKMAAFIDRKEREI